MYYSANLQLAFDKTFFTSFISTIMLSIFNVPNLKVGTSHLPFYFIFPLFLTLTFPLHFLLAPSGSLKHNLQLPQTHSIAFQLLYVTALGFTTYTSPLKILKISYEM